VTGAMFARSPKGGVSEAGARNPNVVGQKLDDNDASPTVACGRSVAKGIIKESSY
jgi:hypothetical protein